ncbi:MAG: class II aldolase/adducin family protein [Oligoflexia bacterium]|nr:class II aldolase/adducin family protein [Oligoflexia bacterium]
MNEFIFEQIIDCCKKLNAKNLLASADGNVSYRHSSSEIYITPTGINKAHLKKEDFALVDDNGAVKKGKPSSELLMHLAVFKACDKAKVVVHAHPPTAIALTVARPEWKEYPVGALSELILALGSIPIAEYARPGTEQMGSVLRPYLPKNRVIVMARHGAISWGESLEEAYNGMERLEHVSQILKSAILMGGITSLPQAEIDELKRMRVQLGDRTL